MIAIVAKSTVIRIRFHCDINWNDDSWCFVSMIVITVYSIKASEMPKRRMARNLVETHGAALRWSI